MGRHAFLILAHHEVTLLNKLLLQLDHPCNDIFIHLDRKSDISNEIISTDHSKLYFVENRVDVKWGDLSQVEAEYALFELSTRTNHYFYYHLLSGVDFPLKDNELIHSFFLDNTGKEFIGYASSCNNLEYNTRYYHLFTKWLKCNKFSVYYILVLINKLCVLFQIIINIRRSYSFELKKGANWVSLTHDCILFILENKNKIMKEFSYTICADEIYKQSLIWSSNYKVNVYDVSNEFNSCMREIDWERGLPYVWNNSDYLYLKQSNKLFARKFSNDFINLEMLPK